MPARRRRPIRPLLGVTREEARDYLRSRGLSWRSAPSNADRRFARSRVRHDLLQALRTIGPAAERTIAETANQLREEAEVLDAAVDAALGELGGGPAVSASSSCASGSAVRRLVLRRLAEAAGGEIGAGDVERIFELGGRGSKVAGPRRRAACGRRVRHPALQPLALGSRPTAGGAAGARPGPLRRVGGGGDQGGARGRQHPVGGRRAAGARLARGRPHAPGRPGRSFTSKTLQDLFTDRKVPRALRYALPVVESEGEIVWVAGVAVDEPLRGPLSGSRQSPSAP